MTTAGDELHSCQGMSEGMQESLRLEAMRRVDAYINGVPELADEEAIEVEASAQVWSQIWSELDGLGEDEDQAEAATALLNTLVDRTPTPPGVEDLQESETTYPVWLTEGEIADVFKLTGYKLAVSK